MRRLELAERVIGLREQAGLTQGEAAKRAGVGVTTWSNIETGTITRPHARTIIKMARALGVDPKVFAGPPSPDWALAAPDAEYEAWLKSASSPDLHKVWVSLSRVAEGMETGTLLWACVEREHKAFYQFLKNEGGISEWKRWDTPATDEKREDREAG